MAKVLTLNPMRSCIRLESDGLRFCKQVIKHNKQSWSFLQRGLKCNSKFTCLFSGSSSSNKEEQARKALESALGGKKNEFEKWNKEIKKREEAGGGGDSGGGGWFGWGRRFGWSNGDNFWSEAQQATLAILGIIAMYLLVAKGEVILAVILNPLLYALRGTRNGLSLLSSRILRTSPDGPANFSDTSKIDTPVHLSAKERVLRKWGSN